MKATLTTFVILLFTFSSSSFGRILNPIGIIASEPNDQIFSDSITNIYVLKTDIDIDTPFDIKPESFRLFFNNNIDSCQIKRRVDIENFVSLLNTQELDNSRKFVDTRYIVYLQYISGIREVLAGDRFNYVLKNKHYKMNRQLLSLIYKNY